MVNAHIQTTVSIGPGLYQWGPDEVGRERLAGSVCTWAYGYQKRAQATSACGPWSCRAASGDHLDN